MSLLVVLLTALAGYFWLRKINSPEQRPADTVKKSQYVFVPYFNADYGAAKAAMLDHIYLLDRLNAESGTPARGPYSADSMAWFVRLAKLEERYDGRGSVDYMREACARCEKLGWADCSEASLRYQVDRMDAIALTQTR
jgi:hypothetical protein